MQLVHHRRVAVVADMHGQHVHVTVRETVHAVESDDLAARIAGAFRLPQFGLQAAPEIIGHAVMGVHPRRNVLEQRAQPARVVAVHVGDEYGVNAVAGENGLDTADADAAVDQHLGVGCRHIGAVALRPG